jgi:hypothetical protein
LAGSEYERDSPMEEGTLPGGRAEPRREEGVRLSRAEVGREEPLPPPRAALARRDGAGDGGAARVDRRVLAGEDPVGVNASEVGVGWAEAVGVRLGMVMGTAPEGVVVSDLKDVENGGADEGVDGIGVVAPRSTWCLPFVFIVLLFGVVLALVLVASTDPPRCFAFAPPPSISSGVGVGVFVTPFVFVLLPTSVVIVSVVVVFASFAFVGTSFALAVDSARCCCFSFANRPAGSAQASCTLCTGGGRKAEDGDGNGLVPCG